LPKPISSKGSEKRWAGAGPTFSLAAGKRSEDEETEEEKDKDKDKDKDKAEKPEPAPSAKDQPDTADPERQEPREPAAERPTQPEPEPHADTGSNQTAAAAEAGSGKAREPLAAQDKPAQPAEASQPKVTPTLSENQELKPLKVAGEKSSGSGDLTIDGPVVERAICGECQKPFPVNMMDKYGRKWVCKLCQARLQEKYQQDKDRKKHKGGLFSGTMERIFLLLVVIGLLTAVGFSISGRLGRAIENVSNPFSIKPSLPAAEWVSLPPDEWPRIVMVNAGTFAESSPLRGGTGFLLRGAEDQVVGVTSSTLLSPDYGVYPPVHPASIPMVLANWKMVNPEEPQDLLRFTQTVGDPFSYLDTPVLFLQLENPTQTEFPVEVLRAQRGALKEQFVYVVTMQPRGDQFVQTVYSGTVFPSGGASKSLTVRLPEAVSDAEVPGAPILDANGHVVGMVVGSSPFQGHMPYEDFEQLSYAAQSGNRPMRRRRDVRVTITLYGVDLRAFPETVEY
jgi:hypothetical protein